VRPTGAARAMLAGAMLVGACSSGSADDRHTAPRPGVPDVYVAIGSSETFGAGADNPFVEAWPRLLYRTAFDRDTVFVNASADGSTVADALEEQVPLARELDPTFVTVWLNLDDLAAGVPVATYERQLAELVRALRRGGRTEVFVATVPPVDRVPAYVGRDDLPLSVTEDGELLVDPDPVDIELPPAQVAAYDEAIRRVAAAEGATVVELATAGATGAGAPGSLVTDMGLSTEAHARVAELFAEAGLRG
jgi:lysophospholipase L1-like esterase